MGFEDNPNIRGFEDSFFCFQQKYNAWMKYTFQEVKFLNIEIF